MAQTIRSYVASTRLWHRLLHGGAGLATHALVVGLLLMILDLCWPGGFVVACWVGLVWLSMAIAYYFVWSGQSLLAADRELGLRDQLVTWWQLRGIEQSPAGQWLEANLQAAIQDLPAPTRSPMLRRRVRRLRWLLPALLLVWFLGPFGWHIGLHSTSGENEGTSSEVSRSPTPKPQASELSKSGKPKKSDKQEPPDTPGSGPPRPKPSGGRPEEDLSQPSSALDSPPLRQPLPAKDEFVIPRFLGQSEPEGAKQRMKVAVVEQGGGVQVKAQRPKVSTLARPEDRRLEFEAAAENARRARHVPKSERGFVKRYFEALLKER